MRNEAAAGSPCQPSAPEAGNSSVFQQFANSYTLLCFSSAGSPLLLYHLQTAMHFEFGPLWATFGPGPRARVDLILSARSLGTRCHLKSPQRRNHLCFEDLPALTCGKGRFQVKANEKEIHTTSDQKQTCNADDITRIGHEGPLHQ